MKTIPGEPLHLQDLGAIRLVSIFKAQGELKDFLDSQYHYGSSAACEVDIFYINDEDNACDAQDLLHEVRVWHIGIPVIFPF